MEVLDVWNDLGYIEGVFVFTMDRNDEVDAAIKAWVDAR